MPIYEYQCQSCDSEFEALIFGQEIPCCPECESQEVDRKMSIFSHKSDGGGYASSQGQGQGSGCSGCSSTNCATCH
jgi:putative FmdB family regulatory protein